MASEQDLHAGPSSSSQAEPRSREWEEFREFCRPLIKAIRNGLSEGTVVVRVQKHGNSNWGTILKIETIEPDDTPKSYFCKACIDTAVLFHTMSGQGSEASASGEWHSATVIARAAPGHVPQPHFWGQYLYRRDLYSYYLQDYREMTLGTPPDPAQVVDIITRMHRKTSYNGSFGYFRPTVIGTMQRTTRWETSWVTAFTTHLKDVFGHDRDTNGPWPELKAACGELIRTVIPRLLGVLQSGGRSISPALIHGDLRERRVGVDKETGRAMVFGPGCFFAHNEMEFGTWRCAWSTYFRYGPYLSLYQEETKPSEPAEEWDDRNRLYSIHAYLVASAGHKGSSCRLLAYNEMLFLCEKYGTALGEYDADLEKKLRKDYCSGAQATN